MVIPDGVTSIAQNAFSGCSGLKSVTIPNSVKSIGNGAFSNCSGMTSVTIPNSVTTIGGGAFEYCPNLTSIAIPSGVTDIGYGAFSNCYGLTSVTIPNSVTFIVTKAFFGCTGLTSVTCEATSVPSTGWYVFDGVPQSIATLYVPESALEDYKATEPWSGFGNIVAIGSEPTLRGDVNGDGVVNGTDIQAIINLIVEGEYDEKRLTLTKMSRSTARTFRR